MARHGSIVHAAKEAFDSYRAIHQQENRNSAQIWQVDLGLSTELMTRIARLALLALAVFGMAMLATPTSILGDDGDPESAPLGAPDVMPSKPKYPRLDSQLNQIVDKLGQATRRSLAESAPISQGLSVAVTVRLSDNVESLVEFLDANAATVANVGSDYIEAYVPVTLLTALAEQDGVLWVQTIVPPQAAVTSQGAALHRSPIWTARGYMGSGVKVGVIDVGFIGYSALMGTELPATVVARCYTSVGVFTSDVSDCEADNVHGTGVTEAVIDMTSDANLYVSNPMSAADLQSATAWMVSRGVTVINHSVVWGWDGSGDGTSLYSNSPLKTAGSSSLATPNSTACFWQLDLHFKHRCDGVTRGERQPMTLIYG